MASEGEGSVSGAFSLSETPEGTGDAAFAQVFVDMGVGESPDIILSTYKEPVFHERVVTFFKDLTGSQDVAKVILSNASTLNISPALAFALCWEESHYNSRAFNRNRNETIDRGLFQLNSATFPDLTVDDFYDPEINASHGLSHLRWCLDNAGTEVAGLAMYNAGSSRVSSAGAPKKTLDYISRVLEQQQRIERRFLAEYSRIIHKGSNDGEPEIKPAVFRLSLLAPLGR